MAELMIVVAIISILALILLPKFAQLIIRSKESAIQGHLGVIRSAIAIYYSDNEGVYPINMANGLTTNSKYLATLPFPQIPSVDTQGNPGHSNLNGVLQGDGTVIAPGEPNPVNNWYYINQGTFVGMVVVNCTHNDTKGRIWSSY